jgi:hypothetical protein
MDSGLALRAPRNDTIGISIDQMNRSNLRRDPIGGRQPERRPNREQRTGSQARGGEKRFWDTLVDADPGSNPAN